MPFPKSNSNSCALDFFKRRRRCVRKFKTKRNSIAPFLCFKSFVIKWHSFQKLIRGKHTVNNATIGRLAHCTVASLTHVKTLDVYEAQCSLAHRHKLQLTVICCVEHLPALPYPSCVLGTQSQKRRHRGNQLQPHHRTEI